MSTDPTPQVVLDEFQSIDTKINTLAASLSAFQGITTVPQGVLSFTRAVELRSLLDTATADLKNVSKPLPNDYGTKILNAITGFRDSLDKLSPQIIAKAQLFATLLLGSNVSMMAIVQMLNQMRASAIQTLNAMITIGISDATMQGQGQATRDEIDVMFQKVIAAYQRS